jgi:Zn-dependent metalloprotease
MAGRGALDAGRGDEPYPSFLGVGMGVRTRSVVVGLLIFGGGGALSGAPASADRRLTRARLVGQEALQRHVQDLRIGGSAHGLVEQRARIDEQGTSHIRYQQTYRGLEVFEGEVIVHVDGRDEVELTSALRGRLRLDVRPVVDSAAAAATAAAEAGLAGRFEATPVLKVLPRGERSDYDRLVWHVRVTGRTRFDPMVQWDVFVDAKTGEVAWAFDSLPTTSAVGTGRTMYSGNVSVSTDFTSSTYYLRDLTRGGGNYTCDVNNRSDSIFRRATCTTFTRTNNVFGNNVKDSSDRATAGADAHFGLQATWDYFKNVHGRNGIDGAGKRTYSRVHYGSGYENAFWSDSCFCMTYGDGKTTFYPLVSIDVAGHEMSHGVMSREANLTYSGESGGLNESSSDIFGTLVEYSAGNALDTPDYWIGERIYRSNWSTGTYTQAKALRYMDDPAKDGRSPACWSSSLGSLDVHYSSGPNNHMFYLLAQGGTSKCNGQGVTGIGREKAGKIWYKAIADYMTASTKYAGARTACLNAATALYGSGSAEYAAVVAAYAAINVN